MNFSSSVSDVSVLDDDDDDDRVRFVGPPVTGGFGVSDLGELSVSVERSLLVDPELLAVSPPSDLAVLTSTTFCTVSSRDIFFSPEGSGVLGRA